MAKVTLTFDAPLNASCQVGDTAYHVDRQSEGGFSTNNGDIIEIGQIRQINNRDSSTPVIICESSMAGDINGQPAEFIYSVKTTKQT